MSCQLLSEALLRNRRYYAVPATTLEEARQLLGGTQFDLVLMAASLSQDPLDRLRWVRQIRDAHPDLKIVVLLDSLERNLVVEAFRCGARGVFCRSESFETLRKCILCVHEGQVWAGSAELQFVLQALVKPLHGKQRPAVVQQTGGGNCAYGRGRMQ